MHWKVRQPREGEEAGKLGLMWFPCDCPRTHDHHVNELKDDSSPYKL